VRALVRFFLSDVPLIGAFIGGCVVAGLAYGLGKFYAAEEEFMAAWIFGGAMAGVAIGYSIHMVLGEFLFVLPFTRSRVLRARLYAAGSVLSLIWLPAACAFVFGAFRTHSTSAAGAAILAVNVAAVTAELVVLAQYLYALPPVRTRVVAGIRYSALIAGCFVLYFLPIMFVNPSETLVPAVVAAVAMPLTLLMQHGAFDRIELLPGGDAQGTQSPEMQVVADTPAAVAESGSRLVEVLPPYWSVVLRGLFLRWAYISSAAYACFCGSFAVYMALYGPGAEAGGFWLLLLIAVGVSWGYVGVYALSGLFSLPVKRRTVFRTVHGANAVLIVLSLAVTALCARHFVDAFHLSKKSADATWYSGMLSLRVGTDLHLNDLIWSESFWEKDSRSDLREAAAGAIARDIQERYAVAVRTSDILAHDPVEGWVIDSAGIRQRLMDVQWRTAVVASLMLVVVYLTSLLWFNLAASDKIRRRVVKVVSMALGFSFLAACAVCVLSLIYLDTFPHFPIPRGSLVAHFWPLASGLAAACVVLWFLSEHFFEYYEFANVPRRKM
jgi:hypothetical protein